MCLRKAELLLRHCWIRVYFICNTDDWYVGTILSHLLVPHFQIFVGHLPGNVKGQYACICLEVVRCVELVELLLPCRVPKVNVVLFTIRLVLEDMSEQGQRISGCSARVEL